MKINVSYLRLWVKFETADLIPGSDHFKLGALKDPLSNMMPALGTGTPQIKFPPLPLRFLL